MNDLLLGLIWVQTVCKGYQQGAHAAVAGKEYIKCSFELIQILGFAIFWDFEKLYLTPLQLQGFPWRAFLCVLTHIWTKWPK